MDNLEQLGKIIGVLGTSDLLSYMTKYKVQLTPELRKVMAKYIVRGGKKTILGVLGTRKLSYAK